MPLPPPPNNDVSVVYVPEFPNYGYLMVFGTHEYTAEVHGQVELEMLEHINDDVKWPKILETREPNSPAIVRFWSNFVFDNAMELLAHMEIDRQKSTTTPIPAIEITLSFDKDT